MGKGFDQVDRSRGRPGQEAVDQLAGDRLGGGAQRFDAARREGAGHQAAQPGVAGRVLGQAALVARQLGLAQQRRDVVVGQGKPDRVGDLQQAFAAEAVIERVGVLQKGGDIASAKNRLPSVDMDMTNPPNTIRYSSAANFQSAGSEFLAVREADGVGGRQQVRRFAGGTSSLVALDVVVLDHLEPAFLLVLLEGRKFFRRAGDDLHVDLLGELRATSGERAALASSALMRSMIGRGVPVGT